MESDEEVKETLTVWLTGLAADSYEEGNPESQWRLRRKINIYCI
jgi:hypothetical protein